MYLALDLPYSEHSIPCFNGGHCWCENIPSSSGHGQGRLHAGDEGQLGHIAIGPGVCSEIPTRANVGSVLQYHCVCNWYLHQCTYQKEEIGCATEEGT